MPSHSRTALTGRDVPDPSAEVSGHELGTTCNAPVESVDAPKLLGATSYNGDHHGCLHYEPSIALFPPARQATP